MHVPHDVDDETLLDPRLVSWLAFADQKVAQIATLARGLAEGRDAIQDELFQLEELGISWLAIYLPGTSTAEVIE